MEDWGSTEIDFGGIKFESAVNNDNGCHVVMKTSNVPATMEISTRLNGVPLPGAEVLKTIVHERIHLDKFRAPKAIVEATIPVLDAAIQTVPADRRAAVAQATVASANSLFDAY